MSRTASRTSSRGLRNSDGLPRTAGVGLIILAGLIYLLVTPEYYGFAAYPGLLVFANFAGAMASAVVFIRGRNGVGCSGS